MTKERKIDDADLDEIAGGTAPSINVSDGSSSSGPGGSLTQPPGSIPGGGANDPEPVDPGDSGPPSNSDLS